MLQSTSHRLRQSNTRLEAEGKGGKRGHSYPKSKFRVWLAKRSRGVAPDDTDTGDQKSRGYRGGGVQGLSPGTSPSPYPPPPRPSPSRS